MRPTDSAKMHLQIAKDMAYKVQISDNPGEGHFAHSLGVCMGGIVQELDDIATSIRATYLLLEEIKKKLDRPGR